LEEMSRVSALQDTRLALDIFENTATFAYRMMNENKIKWIIVLKT